MPNQHGHPWAILNGLDATLASSILYNPLLSRLMPLVGQFLAALLAVLSSFQRDDLHLASQFRVRQPAPISTQFDINAAEFTVNLGRV